MESIFQVIVSVGLRCRAAHSFSQRRRGSTALPLITSFLLAFVVTPILFASEEAPKPAKIRVSGYGVLKNLELKKTVQLLLVSDPKAPFLNASFVEDAVMVLFSRLGRDGYLRPAIQTRLILSDGQLLEHRWTDPVENPLPRSLQARSVHFIIEKGVLFHYTSLTIEGLTELSDKEAKQFFIERNALVPLRQLRIYTPDRMKRGLASLTEVLERKGYESARATVTKLDRNDQTGAVTAVIRVDEGSQSIVRSVRREVFSPDLKQPVESGVTQILEPYSKLWQQDFVQKLRNQFYRDGYPDTAVEISTLRREPSDGKIQLDLLATVRPGRQITLAHVNFEGQAKTKLQMLRRRVRLDAGEALDRTQVEQGRYRLARLGIFDAVELNYEPVTDTSRNVIYKLREGKEIDLSLLFGYGSYELLRAGFELEQYNVWGRAHHARLRAVQSFKSSTAEYTYTMPEFVGEDVDVIFNASGLRREEISFIREEFGGGAGARRHFKAIDSDVGLRYNYQVLNAAEPDVDFEEGRRSAGVGAVIGDITHDRRDNPLFPRKGYKLFGQLEIASEYLVGDVNYQRLELAGSYHWPLDEGRWLHFGLGHGAVFTVAGVQDDLPFNKRFFPGGESSVRGYQQGEAAPRNERGKIVGAETYMTANIEFEQALSPAWSLVTFLDSVGFARNIGNYPFNEALFSVGLGLRWRTLIGPIRLEYGYNLNPRADDPSGTLHFSVGYPF